MFFAEHVWAEEFVRSDVWNDEAKHAILHVLDPERLNPAGATEHGKARMESIYLEQLECDIVAFICTIVPTF
jgi:hypothetical protein